MKKRRRKAKRPKRRIPVAPPGITHKSERDYDRKKTRREIDDALREVEKIDAKPGDFVHVPFVCHMYVPRITAKFVVTGTILKKPLEYS